MTKEECTENPIFDVVDFYIRFRGHCISRNFIKHDSHNLPTLNTYRNIIIGRYKGEIEPRLNFMQQCFVKAKMEKLGLKDYEL